MKLSAQEMLNKFSNNTLHAYAVEKIAMMIFDEAEQKLHEMSSKERKYLSAAALLHDIGYFIEVKSHNKHSMKMIIEDGLEGFDDRETKIIGCICRYHRGGLQDKNEHEVYNTFEKKDRKTVKRLGGILKLADGLGKGDFNFIEKIKINFDEKNKIAEIVLSGKNSTYKPDISGAIRKRDLFEIGFKCQSVIKTID